MDSFKWFIPQVLVSNPIAQPPLQPGNREMQRLEELLCYICLQIIARRQIAVRFFVFATRREKITGLAINLRPLAEVADIMIERH